MVTGKLVRRIVVAIFIKLAVSCGGAPHFAKELSKTSVVIGSNDLKRVEGDGGNLPLSLNSSLDAIGKMTGNCTAFHLGKGIVATAGHCFADVAIAKDRFPCQTTRVQWGERQGLRPYLTSQCIEILAKKHTADSDFALFLVDPIPPAMIQADLDSALIEGLDIAVLGHPDGDELHWSGACSLQHKGSTVQGKDQFSHQCDTLPGHSGSPVINLSNGKVIGVHDGGEGEWNYATALKHSELSSFIEILNGVYPDSHWSEKKRETFGPFGHNEDVLLAALPTIAGKLVSFVLEFNIEQTYDKVRVSDANGYLREFTGSGVKPFENLRTPVTIAFKSDYAGPSEFIIIDDVQFLDD
jgi:hypothetical protein